MTDIERSKNGLSTLDVSLGRLGAYTITLAQYKSGETVIHDHQPLYEDFVPRPEKRLSGPSYKVDAEDPRLHRREFDARVDQ